VTEIRHIGSTLFIRGELSKSSAENVLRNVSNVLNRFQGCTLALDLSECDRIDSAGVVLLETITDRADQMGISVEVINKSSNHAKTIATFTSPEDSPVPVPIQSSILEVFGEGAYRFFAALGDFMYLASDSLYHAITGLFSRKGIRKGEFINQCILIGMNAFPIVALIAFLIGFILALQSAAQLRQFGASIFVADLVSISMTREMGPIMTAILFAGRSGSAIAAEIATMVVTEETDALKTMGLNPVRYVLVPKIYAITITLPLLTVLAMLIGIFGAMVIGYTYLDIGIEPFFNQVINALVLKDILTGLIKSLVFAWIIVAVSAHFGFRVKGGAEGVGRATTASVVTSIFLVILADSILGLVFYFGSGIEI
jgi:phospholipid/cholesterol/gamma-HCH transport system permease protein